MKVAIDPPAFPNKKAVEYRARKQEPHRLKIRLAER
jgi:hypothetical protein